MVCGKLKTLAMSGLYYQEAGEITQEAIEALHHRMSNNAAGLSHRALLAGFDEETAKVVHEMAVKHSSLTKWSYEQVEIAIITQLCSDRIQHEKLNASALKINASTKQRMNAALDKYSQTGHPGMRMLDLSTDSGTIMKARQVNKSSKGKHPSNYTPPKKKRK
jgi:hypothetical protein